MSLDTSVYSQITEIQERMMIFDVNIMASVGLTISIMILHSILNKSRKYVDENDNYHIYAVQCGITSSIGSIIFFLVKLCSNDLILPIDAYITTNTRFVSIIDSLIVMCWSITKLSAFYGFAFMYSSIFSRDKMNIILKILNTFVLITTLCYMLLYLTDDLLVFSMKEIGFTEKRHIYIPYPTASSSSIVLVGTIAILTDTIYIGTILLFYIVGVRKSDDASVVEYGARAIVLVTNSIIVSVFVTVVNVLNMDCRLLIDSAYVFADLICLYLLLRGNKELYDNLCGCLCNKCCTKLCLGSKYRAVVTNDEDEDDEEDEDEDGGDGSDQSENPSFML